MRTSTRLSFALGLLLPAAVIPWGCTGSDAPSEEPTTAPATDAAAKPTKEEAEAFAKTVDADLRRLWTDSSKKAWAYNTDITDEHEKALTESEEKAMAYLTEAMPKAHQMLQADGLDPAVARQLQLLKTATSLPAPSDPARRKKLAEIASKLSGMYGKGKYCSNPEDETTCKDLGQLSTTLATSDDWDEQLEAWNGWRTVSPPMKSMYQDFVTLGNEGAKEIGYDDVGQLWRAGYDMTPAEAEAETERLWQQVKPLYEQLHCHVRAELSKKYGEDKVKPDGLIPAHVTGNMWAQSWEGLYPMLEPNPGQPSLDVTKALTEQKWDHTKMVKSAESFFTSMGLDPLPDTFWERSMFVKPEGKEVVCHASAWDVDLNNDLRIKMCIEPTLDEFVTIHHELGHNYYYHYYYTEPVLFQQGAHDGFHEGIGDTLALSITPAYLHQLGLVAEVSESDEAVVNKQMLDALQKISFLPFGRMIDQWRWDVFAGEVSPEQWNEHWWKLRAEYQGVGAPNERPADAFDPGAKYHIPANTPYLRYFFAHVLQFQFHKALCDASGHEGPLHTCSIYGSKEAGDRLKVMLAMGASKPWPDALEAVAGTRQMDAAALVEYFGPLQSYLEEQNKDRTCGW